MLSQRYNKLKKKINKKVLYWKKEEYNELL